MPDSSFQPFRTVSVRLRGRAACVAALALLGCSAPLAAAAPAQTTPAAQAATVSGAPRISNANLRTVPAAGNLATQFKALLDQQTEPAWIAYTQPVIDSQQVGCCYGGNGGIIIDGDNWNNGNGGCCGQCRLEDRPATGTSTTSTTRAATGPIKLEGSPSFAILFRVVSHQIDKLRVFSADCELDAGGRTVHLLTGVPAAESIAFLESVLKDPPATSKSNSSHGAVLAIALHREASADAVLQRLLATSYPDSVRRDAIFWLAKARGRVGFDAVKRVIDDPNSGGIRKHAVFALTQSREVEVTPMLIELARNHAQPEVRSEALFWMAQRAGARAVDFFAQVLK